MLFGWGGGVEGRGAPQNTEQQQQQQRTFDVPPPRAPCAAHLAVVLAGERLLGFSRKESCLASNANIGGGSVGAWPGSEQRVLRVLAATHPSARSLAHPPARPPPIAGPTTAAGMAAAKGWRGSLVPALLIGIMGYASATFVGVGCAAVFRGMQQLAAVAV